MLIGDLLKNSAKKYPNKIAIIEGNNLATFRELNQAANQIANAIIQKTINKENNIGILSANYFEYPAIYFGLAKSGHILAHLSTRFSSTELTHVISDTNITLIFIHTSFLSQVKGLLQNLPKLKDIIVFGGDNFGNIDNITKLITDETAAILVEPIQGEGGINTADAKYFRELRNIADEYGMLLFMDEVQTGIGRTGKLFAHQWFDIKPDVVAIAKGLGGGFPIGGCLANKRVSAAMSPGTHGSTYGGNPLASAAANAVLDIVLEDGFMDHVQTMGSYLQSQLNLIGGKYDFLGKVKGRGLLIGINCEPEIINTDIVRLAENNGLLLVPAGNNVIRVIPPLIVSHKEIDEALSIFDHVCDSLRN